MSYTYPAIEVIQRSTDDAPRLLVLAAPAGEISSWADVERLNLEGEGHQRRRNESKIRAIHKFLDSDDRNTIPSALTIALSNVSLQETSGGCTTVTIPSLTEGGTGLVIDGQHRLFGAKRYNPNLPLNVVAILNPDDLEIAFQFLVINNKATKVPTDHIRLLSINIDDDQLTERLKTARMSLSRTTALIGIVDSEEDSPFCKSIIWPVEYELSDDKQRRNLVRPTAIEVSLTAIQQKELVGLDNEDALISFFYSLWRPLFEAWPELWIEDSRLLNKAGFVAMTQFLLEDLLPLIDRDRIDAANPDQVYNEICSIIEDLVPEFWTSDWTMTSLDTTAGRKLIVDSLQKIRRNRRRNVGWYSGISLVSASDNGSGIE